jgi:hypothetical protein
MRCIHYQALIGIVDTGTGRLRIRVKGPDHGIISRRTDGRYSLWWSIYIGSHMNTCSCFVWRWRVPNTIYARKSGNPTVF